MTSKYLLTIAIPTYNRPKSLASLYKMFLSRVANDYAGQIEVFVSDNSEGSAADQNMGLFATTNILYSRNGKNLGFAGNVIRCLKNAKGRYLWIISDDDLVDYPAFQRFVTWLACSSEQHASCIMLPFVCSDFFGERYTRNTSNEWGVSDKTRLGALIENSGKLPFVLFSSAVIRMDHVAISDLVKIEQTYPDNDYIQIAAFTECVKLDGATDFYGESIQTYRPEFSNRFNVQTMSSSYETIVEDLCASDRRLDRSKMHNRDDWRWLGLLLWHRVGLIDIPGAMEFRSRLAERILKRISMRNMAMLTVLFVPAWPVRVVYFSFISLRNAFANRDITLRGLHRRMSMLRDLGNQKGC
ncbi:MAG: glycosyltransferase [Candidatus Geothermincolia bacterium]